MMCVSRAILGFPNSALQQRPCSFLLGRVCVKQIWNLQGCKAELLHLLRGQRLIPELALPPLPDLLRAFVLPCRWCQSSTTSGCDCHSLFSCGFPVLTAHMWQTGGKSSCSVSLPATAWASHKQTLLASAALWNFPRCHHGIENSLICLPWYPQQYSCKNRQQLCWG